MDSIGPVLVSTKDGSSTLHSSEYNAHYHSIHGAYTESMHIFVNHGLRDYVANHTEDTNTPIKIFEMGLGSGLNALLTAASIDHQAVDYMGIEAHPITEKETFLSLIKSIPHPLENQLIDSYWDAPWNTPTEITPNSPWKSAIAK